MQQHGVRVELEEREVAEAKSAQLTVEPEPVPWKEYLGETMAAVYRCECAPRWTGVAWQLWIYAAEPERVATCLDHYEYLGEQVRHRADTLSTRLLHLRHTDEERYENMLNSYAEGLVYDASKRLLAQLGWRGEVPFMAHGFDEEEFNNTARDPLNPDDDLEDTGEPGLKRYRYQAPADPPFDDEPNANPPPNKVLETDPALFARGRRDSRYLSLIPSRLADAFRRSP